MTNTRRLFDKLAIAVNPGPSVLNPPSPSSLLPPLPTLNPYPSVPTTPSEPLGAPEPAPSPQLGAPDWYKNPQGNPKGAPTSAPTPGGGAPQKPFNLRDHMPPLPGQGGFGLPPTTPVPRKPLVTTDADLEGYKWDQNMSVPAPPVRSPAPTWTNPRGAPMGWGSEDAMTSPPATPATPEPMDARRQYYTDQEQRFEDAARNEQLAAQFDAEMAQAGTSTLPAGTELPGNDLPPPDDLEALVTALQDQGLTEEELYGGYAGSPFDWPEPGEEGFDPEIDAKLRAQHGMPPRDAAPTEPTPAPGGTQELPPRHDDAAFDAEMRAMAEEELNQGDAGEKKPFSWDNPSNYPWWLLPALGAGAGGLYGAFRKKRDDEDTLSAILSGAALGGGLGGVGELGREYGYGQGLFEPGKGMFGKKASAKATYYNPFNGQTYVMDRPDMNKSAMVGGNVADEQQPLADALLKVLKKKTDPLYQRHGVYR